MANEINKTQAAGNTPVKPVNAFKNLLDNGSMRKMFVDAMGKNAGSFITSMIEMYKGNEDLQKCDPTAVIMECIKAATLHLPIERSLGFAWIIPYNISYKKVDPVTKREFYEKIMTPTFQLGYRGLIQLAMRTGMYKYLNSNEVFEGELRSFNKLTGEPDLTGVRTGDKVIGYFAYLELITGFRKTLYMTVDQMAAHAKKYSKSIKKEIKISDLIPLAQILTPTDGVGWMANFNGMAEKTVTRNLLSKYGYLSTELSAAISYDIKTDNRLVEDAEYEDVTNQKNIGFDSTTNFQNVGSDDGNSTGEQQGATDPYTSSNDPNPGF